MLDAGFLPLLAAGGEHAAKVTEGFRAWGPWLILFLPLMASVITLCVPVVRKRSNIAATLAIGSMLIGLGLTLSYYIEALSGGMPVYEAIVPWVESGNLLIEFGTRLDNLALLMTLIVTGVGSAIFIYALGYMHGDPSMGRFFGKFALFAFSMLGIVLSPNFFQTFVFWELVGVSSYLLIGYYWKKHSAGEAAKKAFLTNRVGDFGFLLGILLVWTALGRATDVYSFDFDVLRAAMSDSAGHPVAIKLFQEAFSPGSGAFMAALAAALVFCGAMGKSAQFPLHVWLPDAMEGPTPVSALMHAATMVAAGIYMVIRSNFLFAYADWAPTLIAWLGGITAFIAASMAITQRDIKKVLAYSTLSQLGYMTMALGAGAYTAAMFHLTTHAFFKALLFLCAGSVIHGCHHEQDMFKMGGIRKVMPSTWRTWLIGTLSLTAIVPIAGWWSKDEILGSYINNQMVGGWQALLAIGILVAFMTAFYMWRATYLTFFGEYRGHHEAHESPKVMTGPLWFLAIISLGIGFVGIPNNSVGGAHSNVIEHFLHSWHVGENAVLHWSLAIFSTIVAIAGFLLARGIYRTSEGQDPLPAKLGRLWTLWDQLYYIDKFYLWLVRTVQQGFANLCWWFERWVVIQGLVNGTAQGFRLTADGVRRMQSGRLGSYVTSFVLGAVVVTGLALLQVWIQNR
jgi:NADH-quinone oxidoreductase subunit L